MYTILIIEDEPRVASLLMNGLEENGYQKIAKTRYVNDKQTLSRHPV